MGQQNCRRPAISYSRRLRQVFRDLGHDNRYRNVDCGRRQVCSARCSQSLNAIWKAKPRATTVSRLIRARAASLGLVGTLGFLIVSLAVSAALTAFGDYLNSILPFGQVLATILNFVESFALLRVLFTAIYKPTGSAPRVARRHNWGSGHLDPVHGREIPYWLVPR